jgi:hypothetical protein
MMGGLGNQLFQYATALRLAKYHSTQVILDYRLLKFFGVEHPASLTDLTFNESIRIKSASGDFAMLKKLVVKLLGFSRRISLLSILLQKYLGIYLSSKIDENLNPQNTIRPNLILGYFQTNQNIELVKKSIQLPVIPKIKSETFSEYYDFVMENNFIAVHVRLGDYNIEKETIGNLSERYYSSAQDYFESQFPLSNYLIFTNDVETLTLNFPKLISQHRSEIFDPKAKFSDFEIFCLMSICSGHIIANSTFSYWAAALSTNTKMVIRPSRWFKNLIEPQDFFPVEWKETNSEWA